jgi:hypothetical protein
MLMPLIIAANTCGAFFATSVQPGSGGLVMELLGTGSFDNSQYHLQDALERILGGKLKRPLTPLDY